MSKEYFPLKYTFFSDQVVCIIHASPAPSRVEWFKNGELLDPSMNVITQKGIRHSLLIQKIGEFLSVNGHQRKERTKPGPQIDV